MNRLLFTLSLVIIAFQASAQDDHYLSFDGDNDYAAIEMSYTGTNAIGQLTVEAWVKTSHVGSNYNDNWAIIDFDRSDFYDLYVRGDNGHVGFSTYGGSINDFQGVTSVNDGAWHHIAAVYDGTNKYIYVDGNLDATIANPHGGAGLGKNTTRFGIIGDGSEASTYNASRNNIYFDGDISELRIWHSARSASELQSAMAIDGLNGSETNLEAYYTFTNGQITDLTGNGHTGELFGSTPMIDDGLPVPLLLFDANNGISTSGTDAISSWSSIIGSLNLTQATATQQPQFLSDGILGNPALQFDGIDDFLLVPDMSGLNTGGPFTQKTLTIVFESGSDITNRQMLYEQGGGTRGLSMYVENGNLHYTAWNVAEDNWGPIVLEAPLGENKPYVATMILDASTGFMSAYLNNELMDNSAGVYALYAHSDDGGLGNTTGSTRFANGGSSGLFSGKIAYLATYNISLTNEERDAIEQPLIAKYVLQAEPDPEPLETTPSQDTDARYNGNISAMRWQGANDESEQLYTFSYDGLNRLKQARYSVKSGENYNGDNGYYSVPSISYDLNGNITQLTRQGLNASGAEDVIDRLVYDYRAGGQAHSNQLAGVSDSRGSAGFSDGNNSGEDYTYDDNGNMISDANKGITLIEYNHLNLPIKVTMDGTGNYIEYLYDAAGIKLQQKVFKDDVLEKTTDYIGEFIYETEGTSGTRALQLIQHEEGRITPVIASDSEAISGYDYQYHLKDHLGNVRLTFSTTPEEYTTKEGMESDGSNGSESPTMFVNIPYRTDQLLNTTTNGDEVATLGAGSTGVMIFLGVQKGDQMTFQVNANYNEDQISNYNLASILGDAIFNSYTSTPGSLSELPSGSQSGIGSGVNRMANGLPGAKESTDDAPLAYINYVYLKKDLTFHREGFKQISTVANSDSAMETLLLDAGTMEMDGYILAYLTNESNEAVNVNFDDFTIQHTKTNVVQTDDYYPFGLTFNSYQRSYSTPNNYKYNGKELQEETGWYDYLARQYDPTLGRFTSVDPAADLMRRISPYAYAFNNPIRFTDPDGMVPGDFLNEKGQNIGNDGIDDGKVYVVKTTQSEFDSGVPSAGITKDQANQTENFISENSGDTEAFQNNSIAYDNSVEIEGSTETRQGMVNAVSGDNGKGGTKDANNREYGGEISIRGEVTASTPGPVSDPSQGGADITHQTYGDDTRTTFHSHPSGTKSVTTGGGANTIGGQSTTTSSFRNAPSPHDVSTGGSNSKYVFGKGNGTVYIYNNQGVQATVPIKRFVTPKKK